MAQFPRFFYSNPKNPDSSGPMVFHLNFPRCIFSCEPSIKIHTVIDRTDPERMQRLTKEAQQWFDEFRNPKQQANK